MLFSDHPKSIDSLLFKLGQIEKTAENEEPSKERNSASDFFLIFSVHEIVEFKQDAQKLIRRLSVLCGVLTSLVVAVVALWLLHVLSRL